MTALHSTPIYGVPNGTEIRVAGPDGFAARMKVTAGSLGVVDFYDPAGQWYWRSTWNPFQGLLVQHGQFATFNVMAVLLALAFHHYVNNRPVARPRQRRAA